MRRDNFREYLRIEDRKDPIKKAWEESGTLVDFETYLENRNESARKNGFKSAYDEYYSNLSRSRKEYEERKETEGKEPSDD